MKKNNVTNEGGINGSGEALVNQNSASFKALQQAIAAHYTASEDSVKTTNRILAVRFQMESYLATETTAQPGAEVISAGEFTERLFKAVGVKKKKFADYAGFEYSNLISTLKGRRKVNSELAIALGQIFSIDPVTWLHIEVKNDLKRQLSSHRLVPNRSLADLMS